MNAQDQHPDSDATQSADGRKPLTMGQAAAAYAQRAGIRRNEDNQLDVMHAIGGWRGLTEALLPGMFFLALMLITNQLGFALTGALGMACVFTVIRLLQRQTVLQAVSGLIGVGVCALFANTTGEARDYYAPGFYINSAYGVLMIVSIVVRWPILGLVFGYIRGEGTQWRQIPVRMKAYSLVTGLLATMFVVRVAVQLPLYLNDNVAALGVARLVMGIPMYASVLWLAWMISRPGATTSDVDP
ncbi:MAG: DUF3159 domain-containing protein [Kocuria sp.]|nr:DUF3159 domain-containing protein [Kocuria sp.]